MSKINSSEKTLIVQDLMFGYTRQEPILQNISFTINSGERVALMGATGAGKSIIYQMAGLCLPGRTLVIDPIIALIDDIIIHPVGYLGAMFKCGCTVLHTSAQLEG